jgi:hypothetical protein
MGDHPQLNLQMAAGPSRTVTQVVEETEQSQVSDY